MTMLDDMKAEIATLVREVTQPVPVGYGVDLHCTSDLRDDLAEVETNSYEGIAEAIVRRWTCPRGQNADDPDYGRDVRELLNRGLTSAEVLAEAGLLRAEAEKEETVDDCEVALVLNAAERSVTIAATVAPVDPTLTPFRFVAALTDESSMLELQR
jgi:hypothetical protein